MKVLKFKQGDWCFCEFALQQVMETVENRITSVSDGSFRHGGSDLSDRCFPLELRVKKISDNVAYWSKEFHSLKNNALNYPDLNRELIRRWVELCENRYDDNRVQELHDQLSSFCNSVIQNVKDLSFKEVEGIRLFRH
jgi:hypothetical protein